MWLYFFSEIKLIFVIFKLSVSSHLLHLLKPPLCFRVFNQPSSTRTNTCTYAWPQVCLTVCVVASLHPVRSWRNRKRSQLPGVCGKFPVNPFNWNRRLELECWEKCGKVSF